MTDPSEQSRVSGHRAYQATVQNTPRNRDKASARGRNCETRLGLIVGLDIGQKALARDLLGSLAEGVLVSPRKGIEMSFDRQSQSTAMG
jgi:hypothetical protein